MAVQRTLSIIKPNAVENNVAGKIIARFEEEGLRVVAIRKTLLSQRKAKDFMQNMLAKVFLQISLVLCHVHLVSLWYWKAKMPF